MQKINKKNITRWFKKGWAYSIVMAVVSFGVTLLTNTTVARLTDVVSTEGISWKDLFAFGLMAMAFGFVILPTVSGYFMEWINKKIK